MSWLCIVRLEQVNDMSYTGIVTTFHQHRQATGGFHAVWGTRQQSQA